MAPFVPLLGMAVLIGIAVLMSSDRKTIRLRTVGGAFAIQASAGALVLFIPWGRQAHHVGHRCIDGQHDECRHRRIFHLFDTEGSPCGELLAYLLSDY